MATKKVKTKVESPQVEETKIEKKENKHVVLSAFQYNGKKYLKGDEFKSDGIAGIESLVKQGLIK